MRLRWCFVVRFGLRVYIPPKLSSRLDSREATSELSTLPRLSLLRTASCLVVSGHIWTHARTD